MFHMGASMIGFFFVIDSKCNTVSDWLSFHNSHSVQQFFSVEFLVWRMVVCCTGGLNCEFYVFLTAYCLMNRDFIHSNAIIQNWWNLISPINLRVTYSFGTADPARCIVVSSSLPDWSGSHITQFVKERLSLQIWVCDAPPRIRTHHF